MKGDQAIVVSQNLTIAKLINGGYLVRVFDKGEWHRTIVDENTMEAAADRVGVFK